MYGKFPCSNISVKYHTCFDHEPKYELTTPYKLCSFLVSGEDCHTCPGLGAKTLVVKIWCRESFGGGAAEALPIMHPVVVHVYVAS